MTYELEGKTMWRDRWKYHAGVVQGMTLLLIILAIAALVGGWFGMVLAGLSRTVVI